MIALLILFLTCGADAGILVLLFFMNPFACKTFLSKFFKKILFILFLEGKGGRKKGRKTSNGCLSQASTWGPGPQLRHVP